MNEQAERYDDCEPRIMTMWKVLVQQQPEAE
jgi:hypothetical protein